MEQVFASIDEARSMEADAAVVIDVLRAFTVSPWLLARGADAVWLSEDDASALALKGAIGPSALALKDRPAGGFELPNSPGHVQHLDLTGRQVVQRTTNGTVGAHAVAHLPLVLLTAFVTARATAEVLRARGVRRVVHVVTGEGGSADEDLAVAEHVAALLAHERTDPASTARRISASRAADTIRAAAAEGHPAVHDDDVPLCAEADRFAHALLAVPEGDRLRAVPA